ncbi:MAG: hypothetical protein ACPLKS_06890 [Caldisericum exile]|uniref:hypothetical protein n=1 Tax=Caldisericum TaxID=693074 RepID=UPI0039FC8BD7
MLYAEPATRVSKPLGCRSIIAGEDAELMSKELFVPVFPELVAVIVTPVFASGIVT